MQPTDLKIGALYEVRGRPDMIYRRFGPETAPALCEGDWHWFESADGRHSIGLSPRDVNCANVTRTGTSHLYAFAAGVAAYNREHRVAALRDVYRWAESHELELTKTPIDEWVARTLSDDLLVDFLRDNFPQGAQFKLCGAECMSAGLDGPDVVKYVTATPQGLQERRLPFAMAAAVVLGHPI